jgi:hypothetical protein
MIGWQIASFRMDETNHGPLEDLASFASLSARTVQSGFMTSDTMGHRRRYPRYNFDGDGILTLERFRGSCAWNGA